MFVPHLGSGPVQADALLDSLQPVLHMTLQSRVDLLLPARVSARSILNLAKKKKKRRAKSAGTVTLARPAFSSTSRATPVAGSCSAVSDAGQTRPFHRPFSIVVMGVYASAWASSASRRLRIASRTPWASAVVRTSSDWTQALQKRYHERRQE